MLCRSEKEIFKANLMFLKLLYEGNENILISSIMRELKVFFLKVKRDMPKQCVLNCEASTSIGSQ
jgi:hypothetical protein